MARAEATIHQIYFVANAREHGEHVKNVFKVPLLIDHSKRLGKILRVVIGAIVVGHGGCSRQGGREIRPSHTNAGSCKHYKGTRYYAP